MDRRKKQNEEAGRARLDRKGEEFANIPQFSTHQRFFAQMTSIVFDTISDICHKVVNVGAFAGIRLFQKRRNRLSDNLVAKVVPVEWYFSNDVAKG